MSTEKNIHNRTKGEVDTNVQVSKKNKITFAFFSKQSFKDGESNEFNETMFKDLKNVAEIIQKFNDAAIANEEDVPQVEILTYLVPDWENGQNFESAEYKLLQEQFNEKVETSFGTLGEENQVSTVDFLDKSKVNQNDIDLHQQELEYLQGLTHGGCLIDLLKIHAMVTNGDKNHLQIDGNTRLRNVDGFYNETFGNEKAGDSLNACFYTNRYIAAQAKVVYTTPVEEGGENPDKGIVAPALRKKFEGYFNVENNENNTLKNPSTVKKLPKNKENKIYNEVFAPSITEIEKGEAVERAGGKVNNVAKVADNINFYRISGNIIPRIQMSWGTGQLSERDPKLGELSEINVTVGEGEYDLSAIKNIIKRHTGHVAKRAAKPNDKVAIRGSKSKPEDFEAAMELIEPDGEGIKILKAYFNKIKESCNDLYNTLLDTVPNTSMENRLLEEIGHSREASQEVATNEVQTGVGGSGGGTSSSNDKENVTYSLATGRDDRRLGGEEEKPFMEISDESQVFVETDDNFVRRPFIASEEVEGNIFVEGYENRQRTNSELSNIDNIGNILLQRGGEEMTGFATRIRRCSEVSRASDLRRGTAHSSHVGRLINSSNTSIGRDRV